MHENYDNDDGHNCHQQHGMDIGDITLLETWIKKKMAYVLTILYMVLRNCSKH